MDSIKLAVFLALVACANAADWAKEMKVGNDSDDCPFGPGTCPVDKDNVVDVFFFDIEDRLSCQKHCVDIPDCHFFTQFGTDMPEPKTPKTKCFLFKTCDELEPCPECETGPDQPPIYPCIPDNYICGTELDNIVDVFYFDDIDNFSCHHQCTLVDECNFWTHFVNEQQRHKCFLFKNCHVHEDCTPDCDDKHENCVPQCETGPKNMDEYGHQWMRVESGY